MDNIKGTIKKYLIPNASSGLFLFFCVSSTWAQASSGGRPFGFLDVFLLPRIWVAAIFCVTGFLLLKFSKANRSVRLISLAAIFFMFALIHILPLGDFARGMGLHPSPLCAVTKSALFYYHRGFVPVIFLGILTFIALFSVLGNKLFCGWVCPLGAVQEITHYIKLPKGWKKIIPFKITNTFRAAIFFLFFLIILTGGTSIYAYFNPFEFFHWHFAFYSTMVILVTLIAAVFIFRPFCYLICPVGLLTWLLERVSFARVFADKSKCNDCKLCLKKSNCPAVAAIMNGKEMRPDCHACGRCMENCPEGALVFKTRLSP